jgi:hypothetical protein
MTPIPLRDHRKTRGSNTPRLTTHFQEILRFQVSCLYLLFPQKVTGFTIASYPPTSPHPTPARSLGVTLFIRKFLSWVRLQLPNLDPKGLFPAGLEITTGVITCGNLSTPSLLVAEFQSAQGTYEVVKVR